MKRAHKVLAVCIGILVLFFLITVIWVYMLFRQEVPSLDGTIRLAGLERPVDVIFDHYGVPHVFGHSDKDLVRVLGYIHAQDRLWQMDIVRRAASGTLSEIFGDSLYDVDVFQRTIGLRRTAVKLQKNLDANTLALIQSYCDGVNAFIKSAPAYPSIEFRVLNYHMEPWTPEDVLTSIRMTGWQLSSNWNVEALRAGVAAERGEKAMWAILPFHRDPGPYIIPPDQMNYGKGTHHLKRAYHHNAWLPTYQEGNALLALSDIDRRVRAAFGSVALAAQASNSWVLSPKKTSSGGAILCNDPHLDLLLPSVWHESHLQGDELDIVGVAFPGTPFIALGHTPKAAWGATTAMADTQDLYKIVTDPKRPDRYLYGGEWKPFDVVTEIIRVRTKNGYEDRAIKIRETIHGPIITDHIKLPYDGPPLALRWAGYEMTNEVGAVFRMAKSRDWKSFLDGLNTLGVPVQNWVYADKNGHIGYIANGLIPIRKKGDGAMPAPGDDPEYAWAGFIPQAEAPQLADPPAGFIATANNKVVPDEYPYKVGSEYAPPYRAMRIVEALESGDKFTTDDMARLQMDTRLTLGQRLAKYFIQAYDHAVSKDNPQLGPLVDILRKWDYSTDVKSVATTFFTESYRQAARLTYEDEVSPELWEVLREEESLYNGFDNGVEDDFALFDDRRTANKIEKRDDILVAAMIEAVKVLEHEMGKSIDGWEWGKLHTVLFDHPFGAHEKVLRKMLSLGPYPLPGSRDTVNNGFFRWWDSPYRAVVGPSMRHVVDFGDFTSSRLTITTGQSAHRLSPHYSDQVNDWLEGRYHPMLMSRAEIEAVSEGKIIFIPPEKY